MKIFFKKNNDTARVPQRSNSGDAGYDLFSTEFIKIAPLERVLVSTGIHIEIPEESSCYGRVAPRSGLSIKKGLDVMAGVVDSSYRGEVKVVLINLNRPSIPVEGDPMYALNGDPNSVSIKPGDRIAQIIFEKITHFDDWEEVSYIGDSSRGDGGFGSTGS